jgi:hypothetical protein
MFSAKTIEDILEYNNTYIYRDANSDVYPIDKVNFNTEFKTDVYIITTDDKQSQCENTTSESINRVIREEYSYVYDLVNRFNLAICGGFLCRLIIGEKMYSAGDDCDVDIFLIEDNKELAFLNEKIDAILKYLLDNYRDYITRITYDDDCVNVIIYGVKLQIVLAVYDSFSQIIHGFDLGSCSVAYYQNEVYFTGLSKFVYEHRSNVVDMTRRSPDYESRLIKYYKRGFDILLPCFDREKSIPYHNNTYFVIMPFLSFLCRFNDNMITPIRFIAPCDKEHKPMVKTSDKNMSLILSRNLKDVVFEYSIDDSRYKVPVSKYKKSSQDKKSLYLYLYESVVNKRIANAAEKLEKDFNDNGYKFTIIRPTHNQYSVYNPAVIEFSEWYGDYYKKP